MMTSTKREIRMPETKPIQHFLQIAWPLKSRSENVLHPLEGANDSSRPMAGPDQNGRSCRPALDSTTSTMAPAGNFNDTFALAYGSITLLGGLIGYLKANSYAS